MTYMWSRAENVPSLVLAFGAEGSFLPGAHWFLDGTQGLTEGSPASMALVIAAVAGITSPRENIPREQLVPLQGGTDGEWPSALLLPRSVQISSPANAGRGLCWPACSWVGMVVLMVRASLSQPDLYCRSLVPAASQNAWGEGWSSVLQNPIAGRGSVTWHSNTNPFLKAFGFLRGIYSRYLLWNWLMVQGMLPAMLHKVSFCC